MRARDALRFSFRSITCQRRRTVLTALGIAFGVAAVVVLTSLGEGTRRFVLAEFSQFGSRIISVTPGRTTTMGVPTALFGTVRPVTLDDANALRQLPEIEAVVPMVQGNAEIQFERRTRRTTVYGVGPEVPAVWQFRVARGTFLGGDVDAQSARATAVIGDKLRAELFRGRNPTGARVRVGGQPYRVVGVVEPKGQLLGFDLDDAVYIPAARALELFDREGLMEIDLLYKDSSSPEHAARAIERAMVARHGRVDFTVTTQEQMIELLGDVLGVLTVAVGALGGISLLVGAVGILTLMTIAATERRAEIGLVRALGGERVDVTWIFLLEATWIAGLGGLLGIVLGGLSTLAVAWGIPSFPVSFSWRYATIAEVVAVLVGLAAGVVPALRAARLDPIEALRSE